MARTILDRARRGDRAALETLLGELLDGVRAALFRIVGASPDLDDLTQQALIEISNALPHFRGEARVQTFAWRIATRIGWKHVRSRWNIVPLDKAPPSDCGADTTTAPAELRDALAIVDALDPRERAVFVLRDVEGYTAREIAELLDIPEGTVHSRLRRARLSVRAALHITVQEASEM